MAKKEVMCTIGIDVDAVAGGWARMGGGLALRHHARALRREIGSPRLLKLFDHYGLRTTWFIPGPLHRDLSPADADGGGCRTRDRAPWLFP